MAAPLPSHASLFTGGPLLAAVQSACVFDDSKTFVDCPLLTSQDAALSAFAALAAAHAPAPPPRTALAALVAAHFGSPGAELAPAPPPGFSPALPPWTHALPPRARALAAAVHARWPLLGRVAASQLNEASNGCDEATDAGGLPLLRTALPLPHACVVPGDRFREVYYWDTFWVVRGLLASGMVGAAEGAARNLLALAAYTAPSGHVPNGARTYYLRRSQPPLLARILAAVADALGTEAGDALLRDALPTLHAELRYWSTGRHAVRLRDVAGRLHALSRYWAPGAPRPESWREDVAIAEGLPKSEQEALWRHVAAAAESGWDFSTRWLRDESGNDSDGDDLLTPAAEAPPAAAAAASLRRLRTTRVVPADLNAMLLQAARLSAGFARRLGDADSAAAFEASAEQREDAIDAMLWDEAGAQWRDLILDADATPPDDDDQAASDSFICTGRLSRRAFASNWMPLWCGVALPGSARAAAAAGSLCRSGLVLPGGVAASLAHSGLQWDFPNAWPPLQHAMVEALEDAGDGNTARAIARAFLEAAAAGLRLDHDGGGEMHEKYDARVAAAGAPGGGGEYAPQVGFGWSNGAALDLLKRYGGIPE